MVTSSLVRSRSWWCRSPWYGGILVLQEMSSLHYQLGLVIIRRKEHERNNQSWISGPKTIIGLATIQLLNVKMRQAIIHKFATKTSLFSAKVRSHRKKTASLLFSLSSSSHTVNFTIDCSGTRDWHRVRDCRCIGLDSREKMQKLTFLASASRRSPIIEALSKACDQIRQRL